MSRLDLETFLGAGGDTSVHGLLGGVSVSCGVEDLVQGRHVRGVCGCSWSQA